MVNLNRRIAKLEKQTGQKRPSEANLNAYMGNWGIYLASTSFGDCAIATLERLAETEGDPRDSYIKIAWIFYKEVLPCVPESERDSFERETRRIWRVVLAKDLQYDRSTFGSRETVFTDDELFDGPIFGREFE